MGRGGMALIAIVMVPVLFVSLIFVVLAGDGQRGGGFNFNICIPSGGPGTTVDADTGAVGEWSAEQVSNAAQIMNAGADLGMTRRDQTIAVMTAIGESTLMVLDRGDAAGPDSRGLFQQRDNGAWGTYEDRMDPYTSATNFYLALKEISARDSLSMTQAAHRVQGNQDPNHYADFEEAATELVTALAGDGSIAGIDEGESVSAMGFTVQNGDCVPVSDEGVPDQTQHGEPSTNLACPEGTTDLGVHDGAYEGSRVPMRLCSVHDTVCTGADCAPGALGGLARGEVVINARYAVYFQAWLAEVRAAGNDPTFSSSFRSWETQARISGGGSNSNAASSGKSHHQAGAAVDVAGLPGRYSKGQCTGTSPDGACMTTGELWTAMHSLGLNHGVTVHDQEFWHFEFILSGGHRGRANPFLQ